MPAGETWFVIYGSGVAAGLLRLSATLKVLSIALLTHKITHRHPYACTKTPLYFSLFPELKAYQRNTRGLAASVSPGWTLAVTHKCRHTEMDAWLMPFLFLSAGCMTNKDLYKKTEEGLNRCCHWDLCSLERICWGKETSSKAKRSHAARVYECVCVSSAYEKGLLKTNFSFATFLSVYFTKIW